MIIDEIASLFETFEEKFCLVISIYRIVIGTRMLNVYVGNEWHFWCSPRSSATTATRPNNGNDGGWYRDLSFAMHKTCAPIFRKFVLPENGQHPLIEMDENSITTNIIQRHYLQVCRKYLKHSYFSHIRRRMPPCWISLKRFV